MAVQTTKPVLQTIGKYQLFEKIAEGGMGTVYKARDVNTDQTVAIKVVPPQVAKNPVLMKRFEQEYAVSSSLDHPNIVRAIDFGTQGSSPYIVMEFVDGDSLGQRVERDGPIAEHEAIRLIAQIAQALHKAHKKGIVHRDVKPDNVIVTSDGTAKLTDLGLVKEMETDLNLTRTGRGLGTPHFIAPEQFRNAKNADERCDIYSLAATLYNMVTGELPFKSTGPLDAWMKKINNELVPARQLAPHLSERLEWALQRAMAVDREKRPTSCREFIEDLTGHSTRKITPSAETAIQDVWYLYYTDDEDVTRTVRGTLQGIRRSLKEGVLGDASNIKASRCKTGPFDSLRNHPEFRDLVLTLQQLTPVQPLAKAAAALKAKPAFPPLTNGRDPSRDHAVSHLKETPTGRPNTPLQTPPAALAPHIQLRNRTTYVDWAKWFSLLFFVSGLAAVGYFVLPLFSR